MKIEFEGRAWSYSEEDITVSDAEVIEKETGGTVLEWSRSLAEPRPVPYKLLYWLMRSQNSDPIPLAEVNFRLLPFMSAFAAGARAEAETAAAAAGEPDPTVPPGTPPAGSPPTAALPSGPPTDSQPR